MSLVKEELLEFFDIRVLRWIECMSLLGKVDVAARSLRKLEFVVQVCCLKKVVD